MFNRKDKKVEDQNEFKENDCQEDLENKCEGETEEIIEAGDEEINVDPVQVLENLAEQLKQDNKGLEEENNKIKNENDALKDRLARTVAEYDNFRKRTAKEKEGIYTDACEDILKELLSVLDNLERAISVEGTVEDLKKGIDMTIKQFNNALQKLNVEEVSSEGEFNPHIHNAVMHVDDSQYGNNQIVEVFQKGYKRGEKVLRYSMVKVAN